MSMSSQPLVSVVTPFHNTAEYLEECIASVRAQTYPHWEYVLLDNCSTDDSARIAEKYAAIDPRIRFIRVDELLPQVPNYNRALRLISPESSFCKMVQADDWIFPTCLEEMVRIAAENPTVGVVGSYSIYGDMVGHLGFPFSGTNVFAGREAIRRFLMVEDGFLGSPTCVMYRSDLVRQRQPFFSEVYDTFEDVEASLDLLTRSDFGFSYQILTYNRRNNSSFWSRIEDYAPVLMHQFILVHMYGPGTLTEEEFRKRSTELHRRYYSMLASGLLTRKGEDFLQFHQQCLQSAGMQIDRSELRKATLQVLTESALHPISVVRKLLRRAKRRKQVS
jgi:glycosyltransferase involved in cell wall biosynthesis